MTTAESPKTDLTTTPHEQDPDMTTITLTKPATVEEILTSMGAAGLRIDHLGACEAGAGNISVCTDATLDLTAHFPHTEEIDLPWVVPSLGGRTVFVTGSGCRLRDVAAAPTANVAAVSIHEGGRTGTLHFADDRAYARPTSEFNSHLAVHEDQVVRRGVTYQAVVHAQPPYLVSLSHVRDIRTTRDFNRAILRWEPETIVQLPDGIGVLDFMVPGSQELMENNVAGLREHQIVLWSKHGIMVRSDDSPLAAIDKVEYAEAGAMYEYRNLAAGGVGEGLSDEELHRVVVAFEVPTTLF
ncbi:L-rhamnulose 1-phosphate aldolase [Raineyella antarctica]|uniref:L-rhamnulose 1-phosphate aldolase n=1 Tax=Raineyella antarctica TaxID=1577474 RepID=A0A1G6GI39_9ACTN|nr:class II aldolase/adducin family protein [Raineyella antarctica]SDB81692.1 L-rhamnulose 1-phosphate aldolase [Raineyella antarctica]